ncbi:hypothetical protein [Streptomyces bottropensis]|uniref:hypothetical protein n=1 Tax=Streptomyces bottropensis TaxID=42235 RepID=UPI003674D332
MTLVASRLVGAALVLTGIVVCLWLALGVPQEWTGGMRWLRTALALSSLGTISLGARFVFPETPGDSPDSGPTDAPHGTSYDTTDSAPDRVDGSRV